MSTGPRTQAGFIQSQSPRGHDGPQSALYYLFQEVSKLASPIHSSFMETDSLWISNEEDAPSFHSSSADQSLPNMPLRHQVQNVQESPFKVLSLINLQCQKLLHQRDDDDDDDDDKLDPSEPIFSNVGDLCVSLTPPNIEASLQGKCGIASFPNSVQPLSSESQSVRISDSQLEKDCSPDCDQKTEFLVESSNDVSPIKPVHSEDNAEAPQTSQIKVNVGLNLSELCLSTQHTFYDFFPETQLCNHKHPCDREPLPTLDLNANICLNQNSPCDEPHNCPLESAEPHYNTSEPSGSLQQTEAQVTASTCEHFSEEISQPKSLGLIEEHNHPLSESSPVQNGDSVNCSDQCCTWRTKRRKQSRPSRSASVQDPNFQGVTFRMDTELDETKEQCRLLITSKYSKELPKTVKKPRLKTRTSQSLKASSDEESDTATNGAKGKVCASCCTRKTPMWRDAEDGTPLCNACGIRYKKYRVRCINCWHIPKKEGNSISRCIKCGNFVRLATAQRRPTS